MTAWVCPLCGHPLSPDEYVVNRILEVVPNAHYLCRKQSGETAA